MVDSLKSGHDGKVRLIPVGKDHKVDLAAGVDRAAVGVVDAVRVRDNVPLLHDAAAGERKSRAVQ